MSNFASLDLSLLRVFDVLKERRSATRAGDQLGVTQSAISHALAPRRLAVATRGGLRLFGPPCDPAAVPLSMAWRHDHGSDPANEWLRGLAQQVAATV